MKSFVSSLIVITLVAALVCLASISQLAGAEDPAVGAEQCTSQMETALEGSKMPGSVRQLLDEALEFIDPRKTATQALSSRSSSRLDSFLNRKAHSIGRGLSRDCAKFNVETVQKLNTVQCFSTMGQLPIEQFEALKVAISGRKLVDETIGAVNLCQFVADQLRGPRLLPTRK